jgi:hypothetical protein
MIEVEQTAQPLGFAKRSVLTTRLLGGEGDDIGESLMIAYMLMVGQILNQRTSRRQPKQLNTGHASVPA